MRAQEGREWFISLRAGEPRRKRVLAGLSYYHLSRLTGSTRAAPGHMQRHVPQGRPVLCHGPTHLEKPHRLDRIVAVERESVVDAGRDDDEVVLFNLLTERGWGGEQRQWRNSTTRSTVRGT